MGEPYYKVIALHIKQYNIIWRWLYIHLKIILHTLQQPLNYFKGNIIDMLIEEIKLNHINYSIKIREGKGEKRGKIKYKYEK